jgi:hypothetical protein
MDTNKQYFSNYLETFGEQFELKSTEHSSAQARGLQDCAA